jgi:hypothetical protein
LLVESTVKSVIESVIESLNRLTLGG